MTMIWGTKVHSRFHKSSIEKQINPDHTLAQTIPLKLSCPAHIIYVDLITLGIPFASLEKEMD